MNIVDKLKEGYVSTSRFLNLEIKKSDSSLSFEEMIDLHNFSRPGSGKNVLDFGWFGIFGMYSYCFSHPLKTVIVATNGLYREIMDN